MAASGVCRGPFECLKAPRSGVRNGTKQAGAEGECPLASGRAVAFFIT
jgi:hypothetical protein